VTQLFASRPDKTANRPKTKNKYAFDRQSPDLNPIEYVWTTFGQVLQGGAISEEKS
jgi:hypothetical protein